MSTRGWLAFAAMSTIWGVPYLFIKIAIDGGTPPADVAWARVTLAAVVLLLLAARAGSLSSLRGRLRYLAAYGVAEIAIPFPLISYGELHLPSSLAAILIAAVPLMIALLAWRLDASERPTPPGRASVITYVNPVVAVFLGVTLLGERPGAGAVAGLLLILAGSWLSTDGCLPPRLTDPRGRRTARRARGSLSSRRSAMARSRRDRPVAGPPAAGSRLPSPAP
ncbi:MAG TPA: DMT family transporter [Solirubrobacteraceae bacterium]